MGNFINEKYINSLLSNKATNSDINHILQKASRHEGLTHQDVAALLTTTDDEHIQSIFNIAGCIKKHIYGDRIVLFAPLYVSDYCINNCTYCGFKAGSGQKRRKLTQDEVRRETAILQEMGHKRLVIEAGEDPVNCSLDYILECITTIYNTSFDNGETRRVNVNIAALDEHGYKRLKNANIGTYILFQETYHRATYEEVHIAGPKSDYDYHISAFERAMAAGIDDVGAGVLFGLHDYKYEVLALMLHNEHLEKHFGVGFHTISVPRIVGGKHPYAVSDQDFLKLVAILRLAVPFTGMIISTRETPQMRRKLVQIGVSQMSAGSSTTVGGYAAVGSHTGSANSQQFTLSDHRGANEIIYWLMEEGILPSFCTACYRKGRNGDRFMGLAKNGDIKNICLPNGILTLKEYALDYGDTRFKALSDHLISEKLANINNEKTRELIQLKLSSLTQGERDLFI